MTLLLFLLVFNAQADEVGLRYNNCNRTGTGVFDWSASEDGKLVEARWWREPSNKGLWKNFFLEGAAGQYFSADFDTPTSPVVELSPGLKIKEGPVRLSLSQGAAWFPKSQTAVQFATHVGLTYVDSETGLSIGLERTHYSSGSTQGKGLDFTGLTVGFRL